MSTTQQVSPARVERALTSMIAAQRMAGAEPSEADIEAARRVLTGEATAEQAIRDGFAALEERFGVTR